MTYQVNDHIHGFTINRIREIPQVHAIMHEMTHDVTGASLIYVQTEDTNKLFSVSFKTIPADDTGVFHILEHSVLSGSEKYPLREPFVELLKSSMNTFLNALTFPDKTMYPVSSRNEKDFHNLMGVYLDAVFAPKALTNPNIFYQEGWHYELEDGQTVPTFKGVVYNEMKGAESSVDTLIRNNLKQMLYGNTCYGYNSGGDVEKIPTLSYEQYKEMYHKYYHPTNAVFYLEGNMDLDLSLADIQSYLSRFEGEGPKFTIPYAQASKACERIAYYDRTETEEEEEERSSYISYAKLWCKFEDNQEIAAVELLSDYLTGSNEAPLCKAVLESGLAEDFSIALQDGIKQPFFQISVANCNYENREEIHHIIFDTMKKLIAKGFSRHDIGASLNEMEFQFREESEPKALYRNMRILDSAMYGGDPMLYMDADEVFAFLRKQLDTDYYERLAERLFDEEHMQTLYMLPSAEEGARKRAEEEGRLQKISSAWTQEEREEILEQNRRLKIWQQTPDTPEVLAAIPKLALSDVDPNLMPHRMEVKKYRGLTILHHQEGTPGIVYLNLYFPIPWRDEQTLKNLSLFPSMLGTLSTGKREPLDFQTDCQEHLGDLSYDIANETKPGNTTSTKLYFEVSIAALKKQIPEGLRLAEEVLKTTRFDEDELILQKLQQKAESGRRSIVSGGHSFALNYTAAAESAASEAEEYLHGLTFYWYLKDLAEHYDEKKGPFLETLKKAQKELFVIPKQKKGEDLDILLSITSPEPLEECVDLDAWIDAFLEKEDRPAAETVKKEKNENFSPTIQIADKTAVIIPSGVSYAVTRSNLGRLGSAYSPKWRVLTTVLRFGYLWDQIRVLGGAYGTGTNFNNQQEAGFYSYRDPDPIRSLQIFRNAGSYLRSYCEEKESLDSAIISTISSMDPLLGPADIGDHYDSLYLSGVTAENRQKFRKEMIGLQVSDLLECADALEKLKDDCRDCVIGHAGVVKKLEEQGFVVKSI